MVGKVPRGIAPAASHVLRHPMVGKVPRGIAPAASRVLRIVFLVLMVGVWLGINEFCFAYFTVGLGEEEKGYDFLEPVFASWSLWAHEILGVALVARARFGLGEYIGWVGFSL